MGGKELRELPGAVLAGGMGVRVGSVGGAYTAVSPVLYGSRLGVSQPLTVGSCMFLSSIACSCTSNLTPLLSKLGVVPMHSTS